MILLKAATMAAVALLYLTLLLMAVAMVALQVAAAMLAQTTAQRCRSIVAYMAKMVH